MKILFTAPRFHTNQAPVVRGLTAAGHEVRYFVAFTGATEDHSCCVPVVLKPSRTTEREKRALARTAAEGRRRPPSGDISSRIFRSWSRLLRRICRTW